MGRVFKTILALLIGMAVGSGVNMALILLSPMVIPATSGRRRNRYGVPGIVHAFIRDQAFRFSVPGSCARNAGWRIRSGNDRGRIPHESLHGRWRPVPPRRHYQRHHAARARLVYRCGPGRRIYTHGLDRWPTDGQGIVRADPVWCNLHGATIRRILPDDVRAR